MARVLPASTADACELRAAVTALNRPTVEAYIRCSMEVGVDATPWLPAVLPVAMWEHEPLHLEGAVDATAIRNSTAAQQRLRSWFPDLMGVVDVDAALESSSGSPATGIGCFFSGGVDSFYSALKHQNEITHLIFVLGFDIALDDDLLIQRALSGVRAAASALGKPLIEVATNIRTFSDNIFDWGVHYHGAALASVGLALAPHLGKVIIPASYAEADLHPWGSHPDLDPQWSSSRVSFLHDGAEATRPEKVRFIAGHQVALDHLRVCWLNTGSAYNCGRCEKCVRTMVNLRAVGALGNAKTLPTELAPSAMRKIRLGEGATLFAKENLAALRASDRRDEALERALRRAIAIGESRRRIGRPLRSAFRSIMGRK
jgi:hypothetical protein